MGLFENWPYVNFHDMNLDWVIKKIKNVETAEANSQASAEASAESAAASQLSADAALASQEAAHQSELNAAQSEENAADSEASAKNYADHIADPVSGIVTEWLEDNITPTTPAVDASLTISGAAADAKVTGDRTTSLKSNISDVASLNLIDVINNVTFYNGSLNTQGQFVGGYTERISTQDFIDIENAKALFYTIQTGYRLAIAFYTSPSESDFVSIRLWFTGDNNILTEAKYIRITISSTGSTPLSPSDKDKITLGASYNLYDLSETYKTYSNSWRELYYKYDVPLTVQATNSYIHPFTVLKDEEVKITNNTAGNTAVYLFDENGTRDTISTGIAAGSSVTFTATKNYVSMLYWTQQTGTLTVEHVNSLYNKLFTSVENSNIASVNMFRSIAAIGDSYTAGSTCNSTGSWADYRSLSWIATMGKRTGTDWKNYGHGGATTRSYLTTSEFTASLSDPASDLYFFALGQNDGNQSLPIGSVSDIHDDDYTLNADTFYGNYGKIIQQIKNHAPNAKLVMVTNFVKGNTWTAYDDAIREIAVHYAIPVIEPFNDYFFNSNLYLNYKNNGHPTAMGYSAMGLSMERLFSDCVNKNPAYFKYSTIG